jgi:hypothetical protein
MGFIVLASSSTSLVHNPVSLFDSVAFCLTDRCGISLVQCGYSRLVRHDGSSFLRSMGCSHLLVHGLF